MQTTDIAIVGGGIVGLSTAHILRERFPALKITILEKEEALASHQTGRNSGVIHSGIYYKPGSVKAKTCRRGKQLIEDFCEREGVAYEVCGKVIVAIDAAELPLMENLYKRGIENGVSCEKISREQLSEIEPHTAGISAIRVHETGIVDYVGFCMKIAEKLEATGQSILLGHCVTGISESDSEIVVQTTKGEVRAKYLVNCAGLYSDKVTEMLGVRPPLKIVPFRGEYYDLVPEAHKFCKHLIYPVPDPNFPFLGVHFTRMIAGGVECGPNAVLAFAREGYKNTDVNFRELTETVTYPGFQKLARKFWKMGMGEMWRSFNKAAFVRALQRLVPEIESKHIHSAPAGIRAQAVGIDGNLVDDFAFEEKGRAVHVLNAPSPAATASLAIAEHIVDRLATRF